MAKNCVNHGIVVLQYRNLVLEAADRLVRVEVRARLHEVVARKHVRHLPGLEVQSARWIDLIRLRARNWRRLLRPLIGRCLDPLSDACLH